MSGLEFLLVLGLFVVVLWPSKKGKGISQRVQRWFASRKPPVATRVKIKDAKDDEPPRPVELVKAAPVPAVRIGKTRRAYVKPQVGAAR